MARREYQGAASPTTITGGLTNVSAALVLAGTTGWPTGSFSAVIDPGQAGEEKILCTSRSGVTVTITTRGYDGTTASSHVAGATIYPVPTAIDFDDANAHVNSALGATGIHGLAGAIVGTTDTQTVTNKTLTQPVIDNFKMGYTTVATAAGTTVLTATSNQLNFFTGVTTQTVTLPVASTLVLGQYFLVRNNSTGIVTVQSSGGNTILAMPANTKAIFTCILTSATDTTSWSAAYTGFGSITGTGANVLGTTPTLTSPVLTAPADGFRTQATANSTLTLTVADGVMQEFTGTTAGQIVQMPVVSTLALSVKYKISNKSTQTIAVNSSGGNLIFTVPAATDWLFTCNAITGTTAASWSNSYAGASVVPAGTTNRVNYVTVSADVTLASSSLVDITGYTLTFTPTSATNKILVSFNLAGGTSAQTRVVIDLDGTTIWLREHFPAGALLPVNGSVVISNLSAVSHTIKLRQFTTAAGSITYNGYGGGYVGQNLTAAELY